MGGADAMLAYWRKKTESCDTPGMTLESGSVGNSCKDNK